MIPTVSAEDATVDVLALDTSALLCRYLADPRRRLVDEAVEGCRRPVVTALARSEVMAAVQASAGIDGGGLRDRVRRDWDSLWEIPIDDRCLTLASDLAVRYGLGMVNAVHLAAFDRLPRSTVLLTFDRQQVVAGSAMGFVVHTAERSMSTAHGLLSG